LENYKTDKGKEFDRREQIFFPKWQRLEQLKELAKAYADYEPYKAVHDMSRSLSGGRKKYKFATDICFSALTKLFYSFSICLIMAAKESDFYEYKCYSKIFTIPA